MQTSYKAATDVLSAVTVIGSRINDSNNNGRPRSGTFSTKDQPLVVLGKGDFGRSIAGRLIKSGFQVVIGSRDPDSVRDQVPAGAAVTTQADAISRGRVVFLAIPTDAYPNIRHLRQKLEGKIVIDVSNKDKLKGGISNAEYLATEILSERTMVVKGFNVTSAWALNSGTFGGSKEVPVCGDDPGSRKMVMQIARDMGFIPLDFGYLQSAREIEKIPHRLYPAWKVPTIITLGLLVFMVLYVLLQNVVHPYVELGLTLEIQHFPGAGMNRVLAWLALTLLALVYFPGIIAAFRQLHYGTKYQRFPSWLDTWLKSRKQLGLLALLTACIHTLFAACLMSPEYQYHIYMTEPASDGDEEVGKMFWAGELLLFTGGFSLAIMCTLGIVSLPSVLNGLNWREFTFVQSNLGYICLFLGTAHCIIYGSTSFTDYSLYKFYTPPPFLLAMILPALVLILKLLLMTPCLNSRLMRIRKGWEGKPKCKPPKMELTKL